MPSPYSFLSSSGIPANDVNSEETPASAAVPTTTFQSTAVIVAAAGSIATAVCAMVLVALTPASFTHFFQSLMTVLLSGVLLSVVPLVPCTCLFQRRCLSVRGTLCILPRDSISRRSGSNPDHHGICCTAG